VEHHGGRARGASARRSLAGGTDDAGNATGFPAVLLSDRGAFLSHIVLPDDRQGKKAAPRRARGRLAPRLWKQVAQAELERAGRVGHCESADEVVAYLKTTVIDRDAIERARQALKQAG